MLSFFFIFYFPVLLCDQIPKAKQAVIHLSSVQPSSPSSFGTHMPATTTSVWWQRRSRRSGMLCYRTASDTVTMVTVHTNKHDDFTSTSSTVSRSEAIIPLKSPWHCKWMGLRNCDRCVIHSISNWITSVDLSSQYMHTIWTAAFSPSLCSTLDN